VATDSPVAATALGRICRALALFIVCLLSLRSTAFAQAGVTYTLVPIFETNTSEATHDEENLRLPTINNAGDVAFQTDLRVPMPGGVINGYAIYRVSGSTLTIVADTRVDPNLSGLGEGKIAIDGQGNVLYVGVTTPRCGLSQTQNLYISGGAAILINEF